jgi:hypothetical protein
LDAAIFLFSRVSQIPAESLVLPVISTNDRLTLGCELWVTSLALPSQSFTHVVQVAVYISVLLLVTCPLDKILFHLYLLCILLSFNAGMYLLHLLQLGK